MLLQYHDWYLQVGDLTDLVEIHGVAQVAQVDPAVLSAPLALVALVAHRRWRKRKRSISWEMVDLQCSR